MAGSNWEEQFKIFLKRAGEDLKRMGDDIRTEAQRLVTEVKDPDRQEKVKTGLRDASLWARRAANDVADLVEKGAHKAETAFRKLTHAETEGEGEAAKRRPWTNVPPGEPPFAPPTASRPEKTARASVAAAKKKATAAKKSVARKTPGVTKKPTGGASTRKSIGRKPKE